MAIDNTFNHSRDDNEYRKFQADVDGNTAVNTIARQKPGDIYNVNVVEDGDDGTAINVYDDVSSVAQSSATTILTYVVPALKTFYFKNASVSGTNIATYTVKVDGGTQDLKRTYWGMFNETFSFEKYKINSGETITVEVIHERPNSGDFNAKIVGNLV